MHNIKKKAKLGVCEVCGKSVRLFVHAECGAKMTKPLARHKKRKISATTIKHLSGENL